MKNWITSSARALQNTLTPESKKAKKLSVFNHQKVSMAQLSAIKGGDDGEDGDILIVDIIGG